MAKTVYGYGINTTDLLKEMQKLSEAEQHRVLQDVFRQLGVPTDEIELPDNDEQTFAEKVYTWYCNTDYHASSNYFGITALVNNYVRMRWNVYLDDYKDINGNKYNIFTPLFPWQNGYNADEKKLTMFSLHKIFIEVWKTFTTKEPTTSIFNLWYLVVE